MYQCLSLRPHKFSVFHKIVHFYISSGDTSIYAQNDILLCGLDGFLIGYNFMTRVLGAENVINLHRKNIFDFLTVITRKYLLILKRIFLISEKF
jgi:hypothetical protein